MKKIIGIGLLIITIFIFSSCESTKTNSVPKETKTDTTTETKVETPGKTHYEIQSFPLSSVKIEEGPFLKAQEVDLKYILAMDVDRLLAPFLKDAGIKTDAKGYPNWEATGLSGHIGGHYLSALSQMYAATKNEEVLRRLEYMLDWLEKCQKANGNGYVGGIPGSESLWRGIADNNIRADSFSLNGKWVPLYNIHKLFAGLHDAYVIVGNEKALDILIKLSDWLIDLTKNLSDKEVHRMLISEHGGLNEVLLDVAEITGKGKYLTAAKKFSDPQILRPLMRKQNKLAGKHANTQIPKVIGFKRIGDNTGDPEWSETAEFFWSLVTDNWTISIGGNSVSEHFNSPDDFSAMISSPQGPETCNTYNMLRLTKLLFQSDPEDKYMDYYERAMFNHILSTENPDKGGFVYFTPMRPRHYRVYSQPQQGFWCCVGTGLENHAKYGEMIYAYKGNDIYINMFIHSKLDWEEKGIRIEQVTKFPYEEKTVLKFEIDKPAEFVLKIRYPKWVVDDKMEININGENSKAYSRQSSYVDINRKWETGDEVSITLPMKTSIEYLPDGSPWVSIIHGPIVLGAITEKTDLVGLFADTSRMGHVASGPLYPINAAPRIVSEKKDFSDSIQPVKGKPMTFKFTNQIVPEKYQDLELIPFFSIHEARYMVYFNVISPDES